MKTDNFCKENRPEAKKKLRLPDQLELVMEDGTVYRVRSFFVAEQQMGGRAGCPLPRKSQSGELNPGTLPSGIHSRAVV